MINIRILYYVIKYIFYASDKCSNALILLILSFELAKKPSLRRANSHWNSRISFCVKYSIKVPLKYPKPFYI